MSSYLLEKYSSAIHGALKASDTILKIYHEEFCVRKKKDNSPVTNADIQSSQIIRKELEKTGIPITDEETKKIGYKERKNWRKSWCVDPLDGTKEFVRKNGEFVINIALIENNTPIFGLIASPIKQEIILGDKEEGKAFQMSYSDALNPEEWEKIPPLSKPSRPLQIISSRSHYSGAILDLVNRIESRYGKTEGTNRGSALKFFSLVKNEAHIYPRFAPTMEWDIAAGQAIYETIGGKVIQKETGKSLVYNKEDLYNPFFVAYNPYLSVFDD